MGFGGFALIIGLWCIGTSRIDAADRFAGYTPGLTAPASMAYDITPSDSTDLAQTCRGIWINTAGIVAVIAADDTASVTFNMAAGSILPVRGKRILLTGTTATGIRCLL